MQHVNEVRGKFVQLVWKGGECLLFASKDQHAFHNQIVAHFLSDNHLPYQWHSPEKLSFDSSELKIIGGGKFQLLWQEQKLVLSDNSMVYGRFDEEMLKESLQHAGLPWARMTTVII